MMADREKNRPVRRLLTIVVVAAMLATLTFIWGNSLQSVQASIAESNDALGFVGPFLELFFGRGNVNDYLIRKIAHFTEFGALGCELMALVLLRGRVRTQTVTNSLFAGLAAAVTDEALQLVSGRGSMVKDVLLDFSGVSAGVLVILCLYAACAAARNRRRKGTEQNKG